MATTKGRSTAKIGRPLKPRSVAGVEQLSDPWVMLNARDEEVEAAWAEVGYGPGEVATVMEALRDVRRTIREGIAAGRVKTWQERLLEPPGILARASVAMGAPLAQNPAEPATGLQTALLYLIFVALAGWKGSLFVCSYCGRIGPASRSDKRYCGVQCRASASYLRRR